MDEGFKFNSMGRMDTMGKEAPVVIEDIKDPTLEDVNNAIDKSFTPVRELIEKVAVMTKVTSSEIVAKAKEMIEEISRMEKIDGEADSPFVYNKYFQEKFRSYVFSLDFGEAEDTLVREIFNAIEDAIGAEKSGKIIRKYFENQYVKHQTHP